MNDLFCTPEQGKRLKELLPDLQSEYVYVMDKIQKYWISYPIHNVIFYTAHYHKEKSPALTLQELRVFMAGHKELRRAWDKTRKSFSLTTTAPELAEWVIARLEESLE